jgi:hypothetical protein
MTWHQGVQGAKEHRRRHGDPNNPVVAACNLAEAVTYTLIEPALDADQCLHALV